MNNVTTYRGKPTDFTVVVEYRPKGAKDWRPLPGAIVTWKASGIWPKGDGPAPGEPQVQEMVPNPYTRTNARGIASKRWRIPDRVRENVTGRYQVWIADQHIRGIGWVRGTHALAHLTIKKP